tara:strand:- start:3840 stop:4784 length:945 start_codon:yes stop_codon:yes gene_type:complete
MKKNKTACIVFYTDERYDELITNVKNSFLAFNSQESDFYQIDHTNQKEYNDQLEYYDYAPETFLMQYIYAYEIMRKYNYEKVIILGSDTIVCSRLDEFLDDNETPVLATLNYWIQEATDHWITPIIKVPLPDGSLVLEHENINADVVCFNSHEALSKVIELSIQHYTHFSIQGGLNELAWKDKSFEVKVVDSPYPLSKVSYNCRSKGVPRTNMIEKGKIINCHPQNVHGFPYEWLAERKLIDGNDTPIKSWYVKDNKLFTHDHKQIKVFHFVEGIGGRPIEKFNELINDFKYHWFNKETIKFFKEKCNCNVFFK